MQIQLEDVGACRKKLQIKIPVERVKTHLDEMYKWANQNLQLKGFRKGKVPRRILEDRLGPQMLNDAKQSLVEETFKEALQEQTLDIVGTPRIDIEDGPLSPEAELDYSVTLDIRPEVEVGEVAKVEIEGNPIEPTAEELEAALKQLADQKRTLEVVEEPVDDGDFVKVDLRFRHEGETVVEKSGMQINANIPVAGTDAEEFTAKIKGLETGKTLTLPLTYPDSFEKEEVRGKEGEVELEVHEVKRFRSPEIDNEFAKGFEFDDLETLKKEMLQNIGQQKEQAENGRREEEILTALFSEKPFDLPEGLVEEETNHRLNHLREEMKRGGVPEEEVERRLDEAKDEIGDGARLGVRNLFLVDAIAKKEKLFVTETDVQKELQKVADENQVTLDQVRAHFEERKLMPELRMELVNRKVREFLRAKATIADSKGDS